MSFRHPYITEFLYRAGDPNDRRLIKAALSEFGTVHWKGHRGCGYYHGIIKDLDGLQTKQEERKIMKTLKALKALGVRIKIVIE